ncbi:putative helicase [Alternaria alternata]|nr:putative helicase [Alternaria alternata]
MEGKSSVARSSPSVSGGRVLSPFSSFLTDAPLVSSDLISPFESDWPSGLTGPSGSSALGSNLSALAAMPPMALAAATRVSQLLDRR